MKRKTIKNIYRVVKERVVCCFQIQMQMSSCEQPENTTTKTLCMFFDSINHYCVCKYF